MLLNSLLFDERLWFVPIVLQGIAYYALFGKLGINRLAGFVPGYADWRLTAKLFSKQRVFWRPFLTTSLLVACALYLNPDAGSGMITARIFLRLAVLIYECFLFRLYVHLGRCFGKGWGILFGIAAALLPPVVLFLLAIDKRARFKPPVFKPAKQHSKPVAFLINFAHVAISGAEALAVVALVGFITIRTYPPAFMVNEITRDVHENTANITGTGTVITPEQTMGEAAATRDTLPTSREKFFPDHAQDESVVVLEYVIGTDLEDKMGLASANITQMMKATEQGPGLTFVLEAGGSKRWFTKGIDEGSYGRYEIRGGKLTKVQDLDEGTCMSDQQVLGDFLSWAKGAYPADRYILVLWDHGGGLSSGYGQDIYNKRTTNELGTLEVNEICDAIAQSGIKFDIIGFDACLMQDIEIAAALEPYADYYLASEEVEGGYGWFYTSAFGMLAQNPSLPSEDFGREIIACFDPYNAAIGNGEPDTASTLSFVDLPLAKAAYQQMDGFFDGARAAIAKDSTSFANLSLAGTKSYSFTGDEQIDLINFLENIERLDFEDKICSDEERDALVNAFKASVLYRNGNSAEGVNGIALSFPVESVNTYTEDYKQLKQLKFTAQTDLCNDFFSIIAAQRMRQAESFDADTASLLDVLALLSFEDYTEEEWYVAGFEDYEDQPALVDIPVTEVEGGYRIQLPDEAWDIVADSKLIAYQKADGNLLRYLGTDYSGSMDENGHPLLAMGDTWVHVGGKLVCYESDETRVTKKGTVFTGTVKALLNGTDPIKLYIEWDPVSEEGESAASGRIIGYTSSQLSDVEELLGSLGELIDDSSIQELMPKGKEQLRPGDRLEFLFDYYDEEGNLAKTEPYGGALRVSTMSGITVEDAPLGPCDVVFGETMTDVYQRIMTTEKIEAHIGS